MKPLLTSKTKPEIFLNYYWLKVELLAFCKRHQIPASGSKQELTSRICIFLKKGKTTTAVKRKSTSPKTRSAVLSVNALIPAHYKNDENHRSFFKKEIGEHFKFNVQFMNWIKQHQGHTYQEAINEWKRLNAEKKSGKKYAISPQFEYNQYFRDFFKANPKGTRQQAIICWKHKKSLPGPNKYKKKDLAILKNIS